jgi:redox-sensitive bicupin YhaK (pirin superfamily)
VLIGEAFGRASPVQTHGATVYLDVALAANGCIDVPPLAQELGVYAVDGEASIDGEPIAAQTLAVLGLGSGGRLQAGNAPVRLMLLGGDAMDGHRFISWNFVSSRKERIQQAEADWQAQRMGQVPGETEFIPLPPPRR